MARVATAASLAALALAGAAIFKAATVDPIERATAQVLIELEGIEIRPYTDIAGYRTCGVGHLAKPGEVCPNDLAGAMKLLASDQKNAFLHSPVVATTVCKAVDSNSGLRLQCRVQGVGDIDGAKTIGRWANRLRTGRDGTV